MNCSLYRCAYDVHNYDAQQHRPGQIISPLTLQTIITAQMSSVGGEGDLLARFRLYLWLCMGPSVKANLHDVGPRRTEKYLLEDFADTADRAVVVGAGTRADCPEVEYDMLQSQMMWCGQRIHQHLQLRLTCSTVPLFYTPTSVQKKTFQFLLHIYYIVTYALLLLLLFIPCDAMLVWYMLSSRVRPSEFGWVRSAFHQLRFWPITHKISSSGPSPSIWDVLNTVTVHYNLYYYCYYYLHMPIGKVWIYRLLFVCFFVCVCLYGYGFLCRGQSMAVHRCPRQGISHFGELCSPRNPKSNESASTRPTPTRM